MQERKPRNKPILNSIREGERQLRASAIETARLESERIWAHVLNTTQLRLYTDPDLVPTEEQVVRAGALLARRAQREPLQHILGEEHFYGLVFEVSPDVLIPRPETELLVEQSVRFLRGLDRPRVFELGTGSGCLAVAIAHEVPTAEVVSVDISERATAVARRNAVRNDCAGRIRFLNGDAFQPLDPKERFDLIVSNPPYIPTAQLRTLQPEVRDFDPRPALDGGEDGLEFYRRISREAKGWLRADGRVMVELGYDQSPAVRHLFEGEMWIVERVLDDYSRIPRILIARPADPEPWCGRSVSH